MSQSPSGFARSCQWIGGLATSGLVFGGVPTWGAGPVGQANNPKDKPAIAALAPTLVLKGHTSLIHAVAFSPDGKTLASGSEDKDGAPIKLWDIATGKEKGSFGEATGFVLSLNFHPKGQRLVSSSGFDTRVRVWNLGKTPDSITLDAPFGPEGASITITKPNGEKTYRSQIKGVAFHPGGKLLATAGPGRLVRIWDLEAQKLVKTLPAQKGNVSMVAFCPGGKSLAVGGVGENTMLEPGYLKLWQTETWTEIGQAPGIKTAVESIAFDPKTDRIAYSQFQGALSLWEPKGQKAPTVLPGQPAGSRTLAFHPAGTMLAFLGKDGTPQLVDLTKSELFKTLDGQGAYAMTVAFSPDGKLLATGGLDKLVRVWKLAD